MEELPGGGKAVREVSWWLFHCQREWRQLVWAQAVSSVEPKDQLLWDDASSSAAHHLAQLGCEHSQDSLELTCCRRAKQSCTSRKRRDGSH